MKNDRIFTRAVDVLRKNDRGNYAVPTSGLYPFQWNWDSCLTALGQRHYDEPRAWIEIQTLFDHQWPDGMVPHIVFHSNSDSYFPGPAVWGTGRPTATSGITQPCVAGFTIRRLHDRSENKDRAATFARSLMPRIDACHRWFFTHRDPKREGLAAILHPWEAGRDNSVDWDGALDRVPTDGVKPYQRRDIQHSNPAHRPTDAEYDRYVWLVQHFRALGWDNTKLHDASPFQVVDPGFNAMLIRSCADLADLAESLGEREIAERNLKFAENGRAALEELWSENHGQYLPRNRVTGQLMDSPSMGGLLPVFAGVPKPRAERIAATIMRQADQVEYVIPTHDPADTRFEAKRYWRGPVWLITNFMIAVGLLDAGQDALAERITNSSLALVEKSGFAEYYDPMTGAPCGGGHFTWTAAMALEFVAIANGEAST